MEVEEEQGGVTSFCLMQRRFDGRAQGNLCVPRIDGAARGNGNEEKLTRMSERELKEGNPVQGIVEEVAGGEKSETNKC